MVIFSAIFLHAEAQSNNPTFIDCSFYQYEACDVNADCAAAPNGSFACICRWGNGDGLRNGTGCGSKLTS